MCYGLYKRQSKTESKCWKLTSGVRGQMLPKRCCCTKIIKHWVVYWFHSLYQCFHVATGRKTAIDLSVIFMWTFTAPQRNNECWNLILESIFCWLRKRLHFFFFWLTHLQEWFRWAFPPCSPAAKYNGINMSWLNWCKSISWLKNIYNTRIVYANFAIMSRDEPLLTT